MSHTANPRAPKPTTATSEPTGPITSDSLAAESIQSGGGFASNTHATPQSVKGSNSTFNTTSTSGATVLPPARDAASRAEAEEEQLEEGERGSAGEKLYSNSKAQPEFDGATTAEGYVGGPSKAGHSTSTSTSTSGSGSKASGQTDTANTSSAGKAETAPTYTGTVAGTITQPGQFKPKGRDLHEGDVPVTKTFVGNVGGDKDPGRLAERDFEAVSARNAASASAGSGSYAARDGQGKREGVQTENKFDVLDSERA